MAVENKAENDIKELQLRPHHSICFNLYVGNGYSAKFVKNMDIITRMDRNTPVTIVSGTDSVCRACPNRIFGKYCLSQKKVLNLDKNTMEACGFTDGQKMTLGEFRDTGLEKVIKTDQFEKICNDCSYFEFCKGIACK